ncbi:MAG TPA: serine hydrolase [Phototrophicaceae bacterium]|nr:serine hydrolase [Phototrophicaceae bacterium]
MKLRFAFVLFALLFAFATVQAQNATVTAEAIGQANLRASPDVNSDLMGQIVTGSSYPVIGRSELYPWVLLADPTTMQPLGWVYNTLVNISGDVNSVPLSTVVLDGSTAAATGSVDQAPPTAPVVVPTATLPTILATQSAPATDNAAVGNNAQATEAPTALPANAVTGTVTGEINVRYGPGTDYDRLGVAEAGATFVITARHTTLPWVQISYPQSPNGFGWVATDLLTIQGDLNNVPPVSQTSFYLPTLTPTPSLIDQAAIGQISPEFAQLGAQIWNNMLKLDFDPATSRLGAFYLMSLKTGEAMAVDSNIAFSGMSINKIAIFAALFGRINGTPDDVTTQIIAEAMICSDNINTNKMLSIIGDGNPYTGAERVTAFLQKLGLNNTYILTPYAEDPSITPQAPDTPLKTQADQVSTQPDPYNQLTVTDLGNLLHDMYQCATDGTGPLMDDFPGQYTEQECRKMLDVMTYNHIFNFIEAGVPDGTRVAHKHGWIDDTHGDAGIVFTPGGDYILVMALHNPTWLDFSDSGAVISESARDVYNFLNPTAQLDEVHSGTVPDCNLLGNPAINDLLSPTFGNVSMFQ